MFLTTAKPEYRSEYTTKSEKTLEQQRLREKYRMKEPHTMEKHLEMKYGKKPLDILMDQKYGPTLSEKQKKTDKELEDLFNTVVDEIEERQK